MVECKKYKFKLLRLSKAAVDETEAPPKRIEIFCNQLIDSIVVGGIAGVSAFTAAGETAGFKVFAIAFGITFLIKLKEYRK
ncbi:hypothetical protein MUP38_08780, partial [Candidatus Bathyarchaeota archaeon]|nr:hypothetical protein [Candidatus Bathyarchaeota archaeon]